MRNCLFLIILQAFLRKQGSQSYSNTPVKTFFKAYFY